MKATSRPIRELPWGHYICSRCGREITSTRPHPMCRDCATIEADLENPARVERLTRRLDGTPERTHCQRGHEMSGENVRFDSHGWALCVTCKRDRDRKSAARRREAVA